MALQFPEIKAFLGLFAHPNSFDLPDGAMERALNIVITDENVISKARGYYTYCDPSPSVLNAIFLYENVLIAVFNDKISYIGETGSYPNQTGTINNLSGYEIAYSNGRIARSLEQNGNLYLTSDNGIVKIDAYNATIYQAGAPPALDIRANILPINGPILAQTQVAYRVLFGRKDSNDNLILGAPGDILTLTNDLVVGVSYTSSGAGPYTVTVTSPGHNLAVGMTIVVSGATDPDADGTFTIASVTSTTFTYSTTGNPASGTLSYGETRAILLEFSIPTEIDSVTPGWFYQLYRSSQSGSATVSPLADFRLIAQETLVLSDITAGFVSYEDTVAEVLTEFEPELYTNPNSREGELQANYRPPLCDDVTSFNNYAFYAKCQTNQYLNVRINDTVGIANNDFIEIKTAASTRRYVARTGVGNVTVRSDSITNAAGDLQIDYTAHGLVNGDTIYISTITGGTLTEGTYFVVSAAANSFEISLTSGGASIAHSAVTSLYFQGVTNGTYPIFRLDTTTASTAALRITAQGLIKAINRDDPSLTYGNYASGITDTPGKIRLASKGFVGPISMRASTTAAGESFVPILPTSFGSGVQVTSTNDSEPNGVYISKVGEPEAVPLINKIPVGSKNYPIYRILALRNSVMILKGDGVFKITGDNPSNFTVTQLDSTVRIVAADSAIVINNEVYFMATEGICKATDSSVEIVSTRLKRLIEPIMSNPNVGLLTASIGYDSDWTYRITTLEPDTNAASIAYIYNTQQDKWTQSDVLFKGGVVGPNNTLYLISTDNLILKERKTGTRIDYCGQNYGITVVSVDSLGASATITSAGKVPAAGDVILKNDIFSRITSVFLVSGANYLVTFPRSSNLVAADSLQLYAGYESNIKFAPYHAGSIGRSKQFSQIQVHTRTPSVNRLYVSFTGYTFGGSQETDWKSWEISQSGGWGFEPWGYFPFGLTDGINNLTSTEPAKVIRLLVPLFQGRGTFLQTVLVHREAGEAIDMQALCFAVRGYQERVTK